VKKRAVKKFHWAAIKERAIKALRKATPAAQNFTKSTICRLAEKVINAFHQQNGQHNISYFCIHFFVFPRAFTPSVKLVKEVIARYYLLGDIL